MRPFTGKAFLQTIEHLDGASRQQYERHGTRRDGRWNFVEEIIDEAMMRMAHGEEHDGE